MKIKQVRSANGSQPSQKATPAGAWAGRSARLSSARIAQLQGQLRVVSHLVEVDG